MIFTPLKLKGAYLIDLDTYEDERGCFYRNFCKKEFESNKLIHNFVQSNISHNKSIYTLRGLHFQREPYSETKLVQCLIGKIWDVIVDLRKDSPTYCQWLNIELSEQAAQILYIPAGFAHGYLTLTENTQLLYLISNFYHAESVAGINWNDKKLNINWPHLPKIISDKDSCLPDIETLISHNQI
jgi:dTDP-4-dehydrorhamnose 3,5-epimerase